MKNFIQRLKNFILRKLRFLDFNKYTFINNYQTLNSALKYSKKTSYYLNDELDKKNITEFNNFENLDLEKDEKRFKFFIVFFKPFV